MATALTGGMLIGLAVLLLYAGLGRIAGISGIVYNIAEREQRHWRVPFLLGLLAAPWLTLAAGVPMPASALPQSTGAFLLLVAAGVLVGFGTRLGNGCTSGHGICGLSRLSPRSFAAVAAFMGAGVLTATLLRPWLLGWLS